MYRSWRAGTARLGRRSYAQARATRQDHVEEFERSLEGHAFKVVDEYKLFELLLRRRFPYAHKIGELRRLQLHKNAQQDQIQIDRRISGIAEALRAREAARAVDVTIGGRAGRRTKTKYKSRVLTESSDDRFLDPGLVADLATLLNDTKTGAALDASTVDSWIKVAAHGVAGYSSYDAVLVGRWLFQVLTHMIKTVDSGRALGVVAEVLAKYWLTGFNGVYLDKDDSHKLVLSVIARALDLYPATQLFVRNEDTWQWELGLEAAQFDQLRDLYDQFLELYETGPSRDIEDLLFRLAARSGEFETAGAVFGDMAARNLEPSPVSIDVFISALADQVDYHRHLYRDETVQEQRRLVKTQFALYRPLLVSENMTPNSARFLLQLCDTRDELYSVLDVVSRATNRDVILGQCQVEVLDTVVRVSLEDQSGLSTALGHMFGVLHRLHESPIGITPEALDQCLVLCAQHGSSAGMHRVLALRKGLDQDRSVSRVILGRVLDRLPVRGADQHRHNQNTEAEAAWWMANINPSAHLDQQVLVHLGTLLDRADREVYIQYIRALGRAKLVQPLEFEWNVTVDSDSTLYSLVQSNPELVLAFMSAYRRAGDQESGLVILSRVLDACKQNDPHHAVTMVEKIFGHEVLPVRDTVRVLARWAVANGPARWTSQQLEDAFGELERRDSSGLGRAAGQMLAQLHRGVSMDLEALVK